MISIGHLTFIFGCLPLLVGCGGSGVNRVPLKGTVTQADGKTFDGAITFLPSQDYPGPSATATLKGGEFQFSREAGPSTGPHQVIVQKIIPKRVLMEAQRREAQAKNSPLSKNAVNDKNKKSNSPDRENDQREWKFSYDVPAAGGDCKFTLDP